VRVFLQAYVDREIIIRTVDTFHGRNLPTALFGTLLSVHESLLKLRTAEGDQHVAIDQIVEFRPRDPTDLPKEARGGALTRPEVLEQYEALTAALAAREPEEKIRPLLGKVIHGATRILARKHDPDLAVAKERCEGILRKCSDSSLPPEES
jgi:hypothetical protein